MDIISASTSLLSASDIQNLLKNPSIDSREETIRKVTNVYAKTEFLEKEKRIAEDIFRLVAQDVEERIRATLSSNLAENEHLPKDIALTLANDISDIVANPLLQFSTLLTSEDLIKIVKEGNESRQAAIASRVIVKEEVASALAVHGKEKAIETLIRNEGARINEKAFDAVVNRFGDNESIQQGIVSRNEIPVSIAERLLDKVSEDLKKHIIAKHKIDSKKAEEILKFSREKATVNVISQVSDEETQAVIVGLHSKNRLSPTIVLRALCTGETVFFENSIAFLTKLSVENIRRLIYDQGPLGLPALYEKAKLPPKFFPAARIAVDLIKEIGYTGGDPDIQESFSRMVVGRLMEMLGETGEDTDIDALLESIDED